MQTGMIMPPGVTVGAPFDYSALPKDAAAEAQPAVRIYETSQLHIEAINRWLRYNATKARPIQTVE